MTLVWGMGIRVGIRAWKSGKEPMARSRKEIGALETCAEYYWEDSGKRQIGSYEKVEKT